MRLLLGLLSNWPHAILRLGSFAQFFIAITLRLRSPIFSLLSVRKFPLMYLRLKLTTIGSFWPGFQPHYHARHHLPSLRPLLLRYLDNWLAFR